MRKKRRKLNPIPLLTLVVLTVTTVMVVLFTGIGGGLFDKSVNGQTTETKIIEIPKGATTGSIASLLHDEGMIKSEFAFKKVSKSLGADGKMKAGRYEISTAMKPSEMIGIFNKGKSVFEGIKVTIPEGYNNRQIIQTFIENGLGTEEGFKEALAQRYDYPALVGVDQKFGYEGFLYPDTYYVNKNTTEKQIVDMMLKRFNEIFKPEYLERLKTLDLVEGDINRFISMAAVVEREAKKDEERAKIAGVFYNRLKIDMLLQSCASVQYILNEPKAVLTFKDIAIESPYNTYIHKGLPPSPIASPGEASIKAALYPESHDYLYFVVTNLGDGGHYFGKTGAEHEANIKKSNQNK